MYIYMDKLEKERFNKMYDMLMQIDKTCAVAAEQNKQIIKNIEVLEKRQEAHEKTVETRHTENTTKLSALKKYQDEQTWTKKLWDRIFTGAVAVGSSLITLYFTVLGK